VFVFETRECVCVCVHTQKKGSMIVALAVICDFIFSGSETLNKLRLAFVSLPSLRGETRGGSRRRRFVSRAVTKTTNKALNGAFREKRIRRGLSLSALRQLTLLFWKGNRAFVVR